MFEIRPILFCLYMTIKTVSSLVSISYLQDQNEEKKKKSRKTVFNKVFSLLFETVIDDVYIPIKKGERVNNMLDISFHLIRIFKHV